MRPRVIQILKLSLRLTRRSPSLQCEGVEHVLKKFTVSKFEFLRFSLASQAHLWTAYVYCICDVQYSSKVKYHNTIEYGILNISNSLLLEKIISSTM